MGVGVTDSTSSPKQSKAPDFRLWVLASTWPMPGAHHGALLCLGLDVLSVTPTCGHLLSANGYRHHSSGPPGSSPNRSRCWPPGSPQALTNWSHTIIGSPSSTGRPQRLYYGLHVPLR